MTAVPVVWFTSNPDVAPRGYWDMGLVEHLLDRRLWRPASALTYEHHEDEWLDDSGAVVIVPARMENGHATAVQAAIEPLAWCLLVLTSDEEASFPWRDLHHDRMAVWVMTPRPDRHDGIDRALGSFWPPDCPRLLADIDTPRDQVWFFAGQITHERREHCLRALAHALGPGIVFTTDTFGTGMPYADYLAGMASAKIAPCPSGPVSQDSFRLYEALEAGCLPIADALTPDGRDDYWQAVHPDAPFPIIQDWAALPDIMAKALEGWPANATRASAWWQAEKRRLAYDLDDTVRDLAALDPNGATLADLLTVVVPTSPIPAHPSLDIIDQTLASVRAQPGLEDGESLVMCDGVRAEQEHRRGDYEAYLHELVAACEHRWPQTLPVIFDHHAHQANLMRHALTMVRTPLVLFVEHDTPIVGDVDWEGICRVVASGALNVVRLHHEAVIPADHDYLMEGGPVSIGGVPVQATRQWSSRPHVAGADFYRRIIGAYFAPESRTMTEDVLHGVVQDEPWSEWRLAIYHPAGSIKRSEHLDGRGSDPKFPMEMVRP